MDLLSFCDDLFYNLAEKIAGLAEVKLFELQDIRSVYSLLNTEDVFGILSVLCSELRDIRRLVCFEADNYTYTVKPGCHGSIRYLYKLLQREHEEHQKTRWYSSFPTTTEYCYLSRVKFAD
ncbi:unnamed protein product [Rotaria magnacalcarata]|uniref:Uncharacterized protein n=1 Tax=Rotaria magnacalcarata TaxID=392030 RepID=A0A815QZ50_9BILA|nr:unnamed protein product [Rotaria magnacalcarata]CAF1673184.1 unnamed protein product [Rotaria magnacalcarata]CAF2080838.1 unnamed protein product [Rotaria magnacalcarata]CAF2141366.1 unnamed protein product [Rotaria magnacalcarata]CAF4282634.1 unnamed protein product [Rotaria magnacalcarata]